MAKNLDFEIDDVPDILKEEKRGRPQNPNIYKGDNAAKKKLPLDSRRATVILKEETWERFNAYCYTVRKEKKEVITEIIEAHIKAWEAEGNELLYKPKKEA